MLNTINYEECIYYLVYDTRLIINNNISNICRCRIMLVNIVKITLFISALYIIIVYNNYI